MSNINQRKCKQKLKKTVKTPIFFSNINSTSFIFMTIGKDEYKLPLVSTNGLRIKKRKRLYPHL